MCDSFENLLNLPKPIPIDEAVEKYGLDFWSSYVKGNVDGAKVLKLKSPLTGAGFEVTPWLDKEKTHLLGFLIKMNVPACVIGNNAFVHILVYEAAKISLSFLKQYLKSVGASRESLKFISLNNAVIKKVDLTYLMKFSSIEMAKEMRDQLETRINSIYHYVPTENRNHQGENFDRTVYLNNRNYPSVRAYIKWHDIKKKGKYGLPDGADSLSAELKEKIYKLSQCGLRIELCFSEAYLEKNYPGMSKVSEWKDIGKSDAVIDGVFSNFRAMLRLNDNLRHNKHRPNDLLKFDQKTQQFLDIYYNGEEKTFLGALTNNQRYELRKKILEKARIDVNIPWELHKRLKPMNWLVQPSAPQLSVKNRAIQPYVFNLENIPLFKEKIKQVGYGVDNNVTSDMSDMSDLMGFFSKEDRDVLMPSGGFENLKFPKIFNMADD